jgi:hypothetical protein
VIGERRADEWPRDGLQLHGPGVSAEPDEHGAGRRHAQGERCGVEHHTV